MDNLTKMIFYLALFLTTCAISTEARNLKPVKPAVYQPQTFSRAYGGYLPNPAQGSSFGIPGAGFRLPSIGTPPLFGGLVPKFPSIPTIGAPPIFGGTVPTFPNAPGFTGVGFGGHP
ncbi:hypothetical protein M5K25_026521 [Dendrobium thyrsiflorum]|uniref:Uncharacterized protein n=1 Tax=Dendrobium thyrsiflorum TaxID=117978 RepID=A0ABD0TXW2_DENTH